MHVVCFDFDNVIADGNILSEIIKKRPEFAELKAGIEFLIENQNPREFYKVVKNMVRLGKGLHFDDVRKMMLDFRLMKGTRKTLEKLKKNHRIVIISINDERMIRDFLEKHKLLKYVDHIYGSRLGIKDSRLTGEIEGDVIKTEKTGIFRKIERLYKTKKKDIVYVGDGLTDLPAMKIAGKGILFCPGALTQIEVFSDKVLSRKEKDGSLFLVGKKDLSEILEFI